MDLWVLSRNVYLSKLLATMHSKKGQTDSSFLGDNLANSPVQRTSELCTVNERSHTARAACDNEITLNLLC